MNQPSAQGIASIYMGNPGALQQSMQKDQQAKPGLPPDLQKMLALQIVTNETDAAKKQMALQQLQQMTSASPGGQMPTVMQTLEAQARQKAMAQAPAMGAPQAEAPMGLAGSDRVAFEGAEGGIVAFAEGGEGKYETPYDRMNRKNREAAAESEAEAPLDPQAARDRAVLANILRSIKGGSEDAGRAIADVATMLPRGVVGAYDTAVVRPMRAAGLNAAYLSPKLVPEGVDPASMTPFSDVKSLRDVGTDQKARDATAAANRSALNRSEADARSAPAVPSANEGIAKDLADLAKRKAQSAAPAARPTAPVAPAPVDPNEAAYQKAMGDLSLDRDARAAQAQARMQAQLGGPDTSQYDKAYAEMEKRKGEFNAPKAGFDGLMEYLGQVAQTGRGKKWYEAGAEGGARVEALNKERKTQQYELAKQQVELMQKKMDAERGYKKELFQMGEAERAAVDKQIDTAVKEYGLNKRQADQLRTELEGRRISGDYQLQAARIGQEGRAAGAGGDKQQLAELKALQKQYADQMKTTFSKADKAALQAKLNTVEAAIAKMAGLDTMVAAPDAGRLGGIPSDVQALLNKYGGK
jgi:hypothetical protein